MSATPVKSGAFVTVKTAATMLEISDASVRRRVDDGELAGFRLGGVRRVSRSAIERLLDERSSKR
jgi:excisionase family DNA binding protein